ncbi:hypothetical protein SAMN04487895_10592 [Paenibacillus sophorae]|uniref:Uncharacterized protein n=1 Tax=Paenibacillus sophorae TaxID=1333845 RepID=A0A1H8M682_9BACL|nr:hypothetical protein [Paenibacillus sophorae]QWU17689.1 hypothetical protein KP014_11450 [Paenibacillus sophorae]SEO12873.1 hypothetical protein SAMN04487895_10592 [Paenibacillus sophorae]
MQNQTIDQHLQEALAHLEEAINQSIHTVMENQTSSKEIGGKWEQFLGQFYGMVKDKGKKSRINLLSWISFSRIR